MTAPTDVILDADRGLVLQPDLLFVSRDRERIVGERVQRTRVLDARDAKQSDVLPGLTATVTQLTIG